MHRIRHEAPIHRGNRRHSVVLDDSVIFDAYVRKCQDVVLELVHGGRETALPHLRQQRCERGDGGGVLAEARQGDEATGRTAVHSSGDSGVIIGTGAVAG